jgi:uncharacterized lipoprotein YajG
MKRRKFIFNALFLLISILLLIGCSTTMKLNYTKPPINQLDNGIIRVVVNDQRPPEEGKIDYTRVGIIRNTFGVPFALRADKNREPPKVIEGLVSDFFNASGYDVGESSQNAGHLNIELRSFWSDGYQYNKMYIAMLMKLRKDPNAPPV